MQRRWKVALLGVGLAGTLAAGGMVFAKNAPMGSGGLGWLLDGVASKLGISPATLQSDIVSVVTDHLNQAVKSGKMSPSRAKAIENALAKGRFPGFLMGHPGRRGRFFPGPVGFAPVAKALGMSPAELGKELRSGKTLLQVAEAKGMSESTLEATLTGDLKARLDKAVSSGHLTAAKENTILQRFESRLGNILNRKFTGRPGPGRARWFGMGPAVMAKAVGMTPKELFAELRSGKTLLQVAEAKGMSESSLEAALTAQMKARLDKAVSSGHLTVAKENTILQRFESRLGTILTRPFGRPGGAVPPNAPGAK